MENKRNELVSNDTFPKYISDFLNLARPITSRDLFPADKEFLETLVITLKRKELKQSEDIFQLRDEFSDKEFQLQTEKDELLDELRTTIDQTEVYIEELKDNDNYTDLVIIMQKDIELLKEVIQKHKK